MSQLHAYIRALRGPILVAGASGFVGANLFKTISAIRSDVYAAVRHEKNWRLAEVSDEQVIAVDLNDYSAVKNLINSVAPQTVFDCVAYGAYSFEEDATLIYQTNFQSIVNFVELLAQQPFAAFIHAGSSSEYGTNCAAPPEDSVCEPNSAYSVSKVAIGGYLRFMGKQRSFPCVNLRLYSVYGPLEDTSRLIPNLVRKALEGGLPPFVDPRTSRDFIHVEDVCAAFIMAAAKMHPGLYGENFNIGTGIKTTIAELAAVTRNEFNIEEEPKFGTMEGRNWDLAEWYSDPRRASEQLGWEATINLPEGLRSMAAWVVTLTDNQMVTGSKKNKNIRKRSVSAIIACYKDGQAIPVMHRRLTDTFVKLGIDYEIIFVNDGSPDDSAQVILEISEKDPRVIGITHSRNFGSQMAFRSGMELSTKDSVVLLDGDLQDPPELIESFYAEWEKGYDVVYGRRVKRDMPWYWGLMYKLFYRVFAMFSYVTIPLDAGDFSLMDSRVVGWLLNCPERDLFVRGLRAYVGFKQTGVDYVRPDRMFGVTTNSLFKNIDWAKKGIFSFSNAPLTMLTSAGILSLMLTTFIAVVVVVLRLLVPDIAPRGATTILLAILMFGSFNLFAIGLVGEYVAKIMAEVKGRPRLIRSALIRNGGSTDLLPDGKIFDRSR
ncbi:NAD-dependent epimerase/dehydratase family protein [Herbaspirillum sp. RTI4]|uniref:NAD-dependent epimerase/dehydratase family protein n=1 Tax=Herbaspirillum sp. RTI4 TaxID=3048640 RepID=UPI002AB3C9B2|nr:NAD-dependent epimerase/dehydratase family protein [Herbaspirillum sp. RTI4]MDY7577594.1 NAD-dependent epimerase/dehydratase family protein [Herbaspirillum sp. RTI4]MEA9983395.1 NAD-dependent epimerase/dehydratase family protein [Herbaspirillum sp. RTI4]